MTSSEDADSAPGTAESAGRRSVGESTSARAALKWVVVVVLLALAATAGCVGWKLLTRSRTAQRAVSEASALLEGAEDDLLVVDAAVQMDISSSVTTQAVDASALAKSVHSEVTRASTKLSEAMPDLPADLQALAKALKDSADARAEMMQVAPTILEADVKAAAAIGSADQAVAEIKAAEELSAQAVVEFNKHTADGVKASDALSVQADEKLKSAATLFASSAAALPGTDFTAFVNYVSAKLELIALAKEIDSLWLSGNVAGSNTKLATYNQRDAEIVAMSKGLPGSVRDPIADAYTAATKDASAAYFAAREKATSAGDLVSKLRDSSGKSGD